MVAGDIDCAALITDAEIGVGGVVRCPVDSLASVDRLADELRAAVQAVGTNGAAIYQALDGAARAAVAAGRPLLRA